MVESRRTHSKMSVRIKLVVPTATTTPLRVIGSTKLGMTPGGGGPTGIFERSIPEEIAAELIVSRKVCNHSAICLRLLEQ